MRNPVIASLLVLAGLSGSSALAATPAATAPTATGLVATASADRQAPGLITRSIRLRDLGYADGITLSGIAGRQEIYFPLPTWVPTQNMRLDARLTGALADGQRAAAQVLVDDQPRWTTALHQGTQDMTVSLPLTRGDLRQGFAKTTLTWGAQWSDNRCVDMRLPGGFVTIAPDSTLTYSFDPAAIDSVRAAWSALGPHVHLLLPPGALTPQQFQTATLLAADLTRQGRQVSLGRLPAKDGDALVVPAEVTGTIIIANRTDIEAAGTIIRAQAAGKAEGLWHLRAGTDTADLSLINTANGVALALLDGADGTKVRLLTDGWTGLADTPAIGVKSAGTVPTGAPVADGIPLSAIGLGDGMKELVDAAEWPLRLDYSQVPHGMRPAALELEVAPGSTIGEQPQLLHVFVNNTLLRSVVLPAGGRVQRLTVPLPDGLLGRANAIRIGLQRQPTGGDCRLTPLASPAQILPASRITLVPDNTAPADFFTLSPAMAGGATLLVTPAQLADPVAAITLAARVGADLLPATAPLTVMLADGKAKPATPFIQLPGAPLPDAVDLPVHLDGKGVAVKDRSGRTLLDVTGTAGLITAQLARAGDVPGLSLSTLDGVIPALPARLALDRGNVAFADQTGLLMAFDTVRDRAVRVVIADDAGWADWLDRFRIALVLGAWALVTLVAVGALRRWYRGRTPKA